MELKGNFLLFALIFILVLFQGIFYMNHIIAFKKTLETQQEMLELQQRIIGNQEREINFLKDRIERQDARIEELKEFIAMYNNLAVDSKLKTPKPRWSISVVEFPDTVEPGKTYSIAYQVKNNLPIKDSIKVVGYLFKVDSWLHDDRYTVPILVHNATVTLDGGSTAIVNATLKVPENFPPGDYILTGAVTYYDVNPVEYIDRRQVKVVNES